MTTMTAIEKALSMLWATGARSATVYLTERLTVRATRVGKPDRRARQENVRLTIGRPNYAARAFIRLATRAGETFPIRKVQLTGART